MKINLSKFKVAYNQNVHYEKYSKYIELLKQGSFFLSNHKYKEAIQTFEQSLYLSQTLEDNYKIN